MCVLCVCCVVLCSVVFVCVVFILFVSLAHNYCYVDTVTNYFNILTNYFNTITCMYFMRRWNRASRHICVKTNLLRM